jgi:peptidoglycan/xylan/chitin deacetylase (PgdA/CDA1 family)
MMYLPRRLWLSRLVKNSAKLENRGRRVIVILSSDTEFDPPSGSRTWGNRSTNALLDGLPRLLDLCDSFGARATFFCEGKLVEVMPETFRNLSAKHEVGCHSFAHEWLGVKPPPRWIPRSWELPVLSVPAKLQVFRRATEAIEKSIGMRPVSFKAPFNSIDNPSTLSLLNEAGFDADCSLPCYNTESFSHPIRPTPTRHASSRGLWLEGEMRIVEVPFMIRPRPLFLHPFDVREEIVDTVARGMALALETVDIQCRLDYLSGKDLSAIHITSHPWEFSQIRPWGGNGKTNTQRLASFLTELSNIYDAEFLTVSGFVRKWEEESCRLHSNIRSSTG